MSSSDTETDQDTDTRQDQESEYVRITTPSNPTTSYVRESSPAPEQQSQLLEKVEQKEEKQTGDASSGDDTKRQLQTLPPPDESEKRQKKIATSKAARAAEVSSRRGISTTVKSEPKVLGQRYSIRVREIEMQKSVEKPVDPNSDDQKNLKKEGKKKKRNSQETDVDKGIDLSKEQQTCSQAKVARLSASHAAREKLVSESRRLKPSTEARVRKRSAQQHDPTEAVPSKTQKVVAEEGEFSVDTSVDKAVAKAQKRKADDNDVYELSQPSTSKIQRLEQQQQQIVETQPLEHSTESVEQESLLRTAGNEDEVQSESEGHRASLTSEVLHCHNQSPGLQSNPEWEEVLTVIGEDKHTYSNEETVTETPNESTHPVTSWLAELDDDDDVVDPDNIFIQPPQHSQTVQPLSYHQLLVAQPGPSGVVAQLEPVSDLPAHSYQADPSTPQSDPTGHAPYPQHGWNLTQGFQQIQEPYTPQGYNPNEPPTYHISLPMGNYPIFQPLPSQHDPTQNIQPEPDDELYQNAWTVQGQTTHCYPPTASHSTHLSYSVDYSTALVPQGNSQTTTQMNAHQGPYHQPHHYGSQTQQHYSSHVHMTQSRPGDVGLSANQTRSGNSRLLPIDLSRPNNHTHGLSQQADLTRQFYHGQQYQQYAHTSQHNDVQHGTMAPENQSKRYETAPTQETNRKSKGTHLCECVGVCIYKNIPLTTRDYKNHMQANKDEKRNKKCYGFVKLNLQGVEQKYPCPFRASTNTELDCHMKSRHLTCTHVRCDNPGPHQHQPAEKHHRMTELVIHIFEKHYAFDKNERPAQINKEFIKNLNYKQVKYLKEQHRIFKCKNACLTFNVQAKNIETHQYSCMQSEINEDGKDSCKQPKTLDKPFKCEFKQWNGNKWEQCKEKPTGYGAAGSLYKHYIRKHKAECYFRFAVSYGCVSVENYIKTKNAAAKCLLCDGSVGENDHLHVPTPTFTTINKWDNEFAKAFANESHSEHWRAVVNAKYDKKEDWKFNPYVIGNVKEICKRPVFPEGIAPTQQSLSMQATVGNEKQ